MNLSKPITKILIGMILLSCFVTVFTAKPVDAGMNGTIVFHQTGLASGTAWTIKIQTTNYTSTSSAYSTSWLGGLPCPWQIYVPDGYSSTSTLSGITYVVADEITVIYVTFTPSGHNVVFTESGLASETLWNITFNGNLYSSTTSSITIPNCPDGNYAYTIHTPNGYQIGTQASATLTVAGANVEKAVTFVSSTSDWYMSRRDVLHSGYADTSAPLNNNTLWVTSLNEITTSSPAIVNGILYIGTTNGTIYALNTADGSIIWDYVTGGAVKSSPAVVGGVVFVASDDQYLYALNAAEGSLIWLYNVTGSDLNVSPTVVDGTVYIGEDNRILSINATDGTLNWEKTVSGYFESSVPIVVDGLLCFGMYDSRSVFVLNATDGSEIWSYNTWSHVCTSPTIVDGVIYIGNNECRLYALNLTATGNPYLWDVHLGGTSAQFSSSPTYCNGVIYIGDTDGTMYARSAADGSEIWTSTAGRFLYSSAAVADGVVYIGSHDKNLYAFNATDGTIIWTYATGDAIWSSPAIVDGTVYIASGDGKIYAFNTLTSTVTFTETGLPSGTSWTVTLDGIRKTSYDNSITFTDIAYGTYDYTIGVPTGYVASATSGSITVNRAETQQTITFAANPNNWWMLGNGLGHTGYSTSSGPLTSELLWSRSTGYISSPTALIAANGVLYFGGSNSIYARSATTGNLIRTYSLGSSYFPSSPVSPALVDDILYFGTEDCKVMALNLTSGDIIWTFTTGAGVSGCPAIANGVLYVGSSDYKVYALNATTGSQLWSFTTGGLVGSSPAVSNGMVFISSQDGKLYAFNALTGVKIWEYSSAGKTSFNQAPCVENGVVYGNVYSYSGTGLFFALNATTGAEIWTLNTITMPAAAVANGIVYFNDNYGYTFAVNATTGSQIWTYQTVSAYRAVVIASNIVYVQGSNQMFAFNATTGSLIWSYSLYTSVFYNSPIIVNGIVYAFSPGMDDDGTIYAFGTIEQYDLTMTTIGQGTVLPGNQTYIGGTNVNIVAIPDAGWSFAGWTGAAEGSTNTTITMNANKTVTATFTQNNYTLTMITVGTGSVTPGNQTTYHYGDTVNITAAATSPYSFSGWSGDTSGNTNKTITITGNMTITATFTLNTYTITVNQGSHGTISPSTVTVNGGFSQTFTISPDVGYHIVDVTVDGSSVGAVSSYQFSNVQGDHSITAVFAPNEYTLTITTVGNGTANANPAAAIYHYGDTVQLNAYPDNGWTFGGWSGDASGTTNTTITINGNKAVTATFTQNSYQVVFDLTGVSSSFTGVVLTVDGTGYTAADLPKAFMWLHGSVHTFAFNQTLPVSNGERYTWTSTSGASQLQSGSLTITNTATVTAAYGTQYQLTVTTSQGTVSGSGWYTAGTSAVAQVTQSIVTSGTDTRYVFNGWSGDAQGSQSSITVAVDGPKTVTANWETQYQVTVTANPTSGGIVTPSRATWTPAGTLEISCTPNTGYQFTSWSSTAQITITATTSTVVTATINGPGTITANFNQTTETLYVKTSDGKTRELEMSGNISASQLSDGKITTMLGTLTTKISFTATGPSGTSGFTNMTIPKSSVTYGTKPVVYIDGVAASDQGYTQDYYNYYVWFTTHFSTHEVSIDFITEETAPTSTPAQQASTSNLALPAALAAAIIAIVIAGLFVQQRRKHKTKQA